MEEAEPTGQPDRRDPGPVFISYATADRKQALSVCEAIERRDTLCWISCRDVAPGDNYQEAIVHAIRAAPAMVLVFSAAANASDEIKKELSLASRYHVPVIALRLSNVDPSDAFAYELATRQWIDAFEGWERSIDLLVRRIGQLPGAVPADSGSKSQPASQTTSSLLRRRAAMGMAGVLLLLLIGGAWWSLRPAPAEAHSMAVRLAGFQLLSADLPATIREAVDAEIAASFNADGVVGVSNASAPPPGSAPSYALGGTIQRDGEIVRVITQLVDERSGTTLWSDKFNYDARELARVPHHIAVDAGNVVRCGLFGASTYHKPLPDPVLGDYMQFCQGHWDPDLKEGRKALIPAQRTVAAAPDFSWGWAAVAGAYWKVAMSADTKAISEDARANGRQAADRAIAIDGRNSEALYIKAVLLGSGDWLGREALFKRAVAARRLDCGCEHHQYGWMLVDVGRTADGLEQLRQANNMLALYVYTPLTLADALVVAGRPDEAKQYFDAAIDLAPTSSFAKGLVAEKASRLGDIELLHDPTLPITANLRSALLKGYSALASKNASAKAQAAQLLMTLPEEQQDETVARLLGSLGANHAAFEVAARAAKDSVYPGPSIFWYPSMRGAIDDPGFYAAANRMGLLSYWKATGTKPDVCSSSRPPAFCRMI